MLLTDTVITTRYNQGIDYLTNIAFGKHLKDRYGVQYKDTATDKNLLMLLYAADSWDNTPGAIDNWLSETQFMAILDAINGAHADGLTKPITLTSNISNCGSTSVGDYSNVKIRVSDTQSIHLTYVNNVLTAQLILDPQVDNASTVTDAGLYTTPGGGGGGGGAIIGDF